jgi:rhodanese-related sulfurtransferase
MSFIIQLLTLIMHKINAHFIKSIPFFSLSFILTLAACQFQQPDYLKMLTPVELQEIMQKSDIFLVDVHVPQQKHIKGTDAVIPFNDIENNQSRLPQDKNTPIYLYCEGGPMGNAAAQKLHELGYQNLFNLSGGAHAWKNAGYAFD